MANPSLKGLVGRYEFHDNSKNSHKFWILTYDPDSGLYTRAWGRIGTTGNSQEGLGGTEALHAVQGKISKGYLKVDDGDDENFDYDENDFDPDAFMKELGDMEED